MGNSWAYDPKSWSRAVFLPDSYFLFPQVCLLSSSFLLCSWYSKVSCGTPLRLMYSRWFHMSLVSPSASSLGKHGDVTAPCISTAPIFLCMFTFGLHEVGVHFIRRSWYVGHPAGKSLGFLIKPFSLLMPVVLEHTPSALFTAAV